MMVTRKQQRETVGELAAQAALERSLEFKLTLPSLLLHLMARCAQFADCTVKPLHSRNAVKIDGVPDWCVEFRFHTAATDSVSVGPETEEWEYEMLVSTVEGVEAERRVEAERLTLAREVFDSLTPAQRLAIGLKHRP